MRELDAVAVRYAQLLAPLERVGEPLALGRTLRIQEAGVQDSNNVSSMQYSPDNA